MADDNEAVGDEHVPTVTYAWAEGARPPARVTAEQVGAALEDIGRRKGFVQPDVVLEEARPEDAPLHHAFEWDDEVAAEKYRLVEARNLIRSVRVVAVDNKPTPSVRAFVSIVDAGGQRAYFPTVAYPEHEAARGWRELLSWRRRYGHILEFMAVVVAINDEEEENTGGMSFRS